MTTSFTFGCAICTESFDIHKKVCATRCGHVYHETCLQRWMTSQSTQMIPTTCPKCRAAVCGHQVLRLFLHQVDSSEHDASSENEAESDDDSIHSCAETDFEFSDVDTLSSGSTTEEEEEGRTVNGVSRYSFMDEVRQLQFGRNMDLLSALDRRLDEALNEINTMDNTVDHFLDTFNTDM